MWNLDKEEMWFLLKCYSDYVDEKIDNEYDTGYPVCLKEFYNNEYVELYDHYLDYLWEDLGYIAIDKYDNIDEDFYIWKKGTHREKIWHWFDERVENGIINRYFN